MIRHIVMFEFAKEAEGRTAIENAVIAKNQLLELTEKLDFIRRMEVGINDSDADETNYTLCLTCDFDSLEDLNRYAVNPEHLKVGAFISRVRLSRACVDYEL
ncbi:Dabb family protein [Anaerosporobacter faecicola]|uniref:Dabb family protein n=1 Tax=Anaerosporobacter faecicola TaxID=2718714 RepID=UPI00143AC21D|nr:Dabb family protein [Anaerosporobacter faecicola]